MASSAARLGQIRAQLELARNFYDDFEFCPVQCSSEVLEHRDRINQRLSPQSSPSTSPNMSFANRNGGGGGGGGNITPKIRRAIPIINPSNMAPVSLPSSQQQQHGMKSFVSPTTNFNYQQPQQHYYKNGNRSQHHHMGGSYYDVLVQ